MKKNYLMVCISLMAAVSIVQATDNMKAFPPAEDGMERYVLHLAGMEDEAAFKVEIIVGKTVAVDANRYFFGGSIKSENITGWGYTRYVVDELGPMAGTLMATDPDAPKEERFITLGGEPYLIRYNSRLPVVVYVPKCVEVRFRVWSAGEAQEMKKG
jgi:ecotin